MNNQRIHSHALPALAAMLILSLPARIEPLEKRALLVTRGE